MQEQLEVGNFWETVSFLCWHVQMVCLRKGCAVLNGEVQEDC